MSKLERIEAQLELLNEIFHANREDITYKNVLKMISELSKIYQDAIRFNSIFDSICNDPFECLGSTNGNTVFFACLN